MLHCYINDLRLQQRSAYHQTPLSHRCQFKRCSFLWRCWWWTHGNTSSIVTCTRTSSFTAISTLGITASSSLMQLEPFTTIHWRVSFSILLAAASHSWSRGWPRELLCSFSASRRWKPSMTIVAFGCPGTSSTSSSTTTQPTMTSIISFKDWSTITLNLSSPFGIDSWGLTCLTTWSLGEKVDWRQDLQKIKLHNLCIYTSDRETDVPVEMNFSNYLKNKFSLAIIAGAYKGCRIALLSLFGKLTNWLRLL